MGRADLPSGTVTFLFTDIEGSTKLLHELGAEPYADALATHRRILRAAFTAHGGVEVDTQGDAFFVAFPTAPGALAAAAQAREALSDGPITVRMGLHTGTPHLTDEGYVGPDVHRAARIAATGHGGQILVSSATATLVEAALMDLGAHRLKDLSGPERIFQLGAEAHPPLKSLHQTNLPIPATPFLGRETEVAEVAALLERDDIRIVTLTGPGGMGKTRLALQAAAHSADAYPGGVWWVPLAALRDAALVIESAAKALGASGDLAEHIGDRGLLLLLDNFEHLTAAATDLAPLLASCPNLTVLVTSREPLHLDGEWEFEVDPLDRADAVELFLTRAAAVKRDIVANGEVAAICDRLDHLPLAIELAAARVKVLTPRALLERLEQRLPLLAGGTRDAPERQRTLRATIQWSHELLTTDEQRLFARLAVFRGGCTIEAAEAAIGADLDTLQSLVDKSLVRVRDTGRFWMLETIREFATERLNASGDADAIRQRHADFFLALAEEAEPHLRGNPRAWIDLLEADLDNLRGTQDWFRERDDELAEVRLVAAIWRLWMLRGHFAEGDRRMEAVRRGAAAGTLARANALNGLTAIAMARDADGAAAAAADEALALHQELGDRSGIANSTFLLGHVAAEAGDFARGRALFVEALATFRELNDSHYTLLALRNQAWMEYELGHRAEATALHEEVVELARANDNPRMEASSLGALAEYQIIGGRPADGLDLLQRSTRMFQELAERIEVTIALRRFARAFAELDHIETALTLLGAADAADDDMGAGRAAWVRDLDDGAIEMAGRSLDHETIARLRQEGRSTPLDDAVDLAIATAASIPGTNAH